MIPVVIVIGSVLASIAVVAMVIVLVRRYERQRTEAMHALADELGLEFIPEEVPELMESIGHLHLFNIGHGRTMKNVIVGNANDIDLAIFGYQYTTGGGQSQQTISQTVMSFRSPKLNLPDFELRPESVFHKIGKVLGYQDIDFASHPDFSKQYLLRGPDEDAVRAMFTPELLSFFESQEKVSAEASGNLLLFYRAGKRLNPEKIRTFMEEGFAIFGQMASPDS